MCLTDRQGRARQPKHDTGRYRVGGPGTLKAWAPAGAVWWAGWVTEVPSQLRLQLPAQAEPAGQLPDGGRPGLPGS